MTNLKISPEAKKDLLDIKEYITEELGNPLAATNVLSKITHRMRQLIEFPLLGKTLNSILNVETNYRFLVCGNYIVFYHYEMNNVYINRILHSRRNYMKILFGDISDAEI